MLLLLVDVTEDVVLGVDKYLNGDGVVVVLQRRHVIVAHRQLRLGIDLIPTSVQQTKQSVTRFAGYRSEVSLKKN